MSGAHTVRRAIILAAGKGERMRPVTETTPKSLVRVNGARMIDTVIRGLRHHGICEIYVVVGYLKEQFAALETEYPGLRLIENPYYDSCNNISSLYVARAHLEDAIITDADLIITDPGVLSPGFDRSGYNCVWTEGETGEWLLREKDGVVCSCSRTGGRRGWQLVSISRWSGEDGARLRRHLEMEFEEKRHRDIYWDDVALFCYPEEYRLGIREMAPGAVTELDTLEELIAADSSYASYTETKKA